MRSYLVADDFSGTSSTWDLLWVLFILGIIITLIVLLLKFIGKRNRGWWMNRSLRSLGGHTLGTNKSLQIVEWNGRIYVLGVGNDITLLESITDPDTVAVLLAEFDTASAETNATLPEWLRKWGQRKGNNVDKQEDSQTLSSSSFEQTLENRLRQLSERRQKVEELMDDRSSDDRNDQR
ncbi:MAG: flagellar biosynthetic protein FliO [Candidatus Cohnella colombiensis]|uniref:Flagellar biosynthetic protein FliO n=1 Tax=Candidatus Cohnella colombiensis TaxID=3121368 RepID=A0AA95F3G5_9BACL|nr:MAG: flagellar biosynthetic protein FliO [Cohnella sp.]